MTIIITKKVCLDATLVITASIKDVENASEVEKGMNKTGHGGHWNRMGSELYRSERLSGQCANPKGIESFVSMAAKDVERYKSELDRLAAL